MSRKRRRVRLTLTVLFTLIVFCILTITMVLVGAITVTMRYMGLFSHLSVPNMSFLLAIVAIASVLVGTAFTAIISSIPLKPLNRLIGGMNELAGGNYQTRLYFGENKVGKEVADSFNTLASELENTELLQSDFVNNFSHEFKTPIVSIRGFAKLLQKGNLSEQTQREYIDIIVEESSRLAVMATNVLNLAKVENQSILSDVARFNLSEQIRGCALLLETKWEKKDLALNMDFNEYQISASEELLKQVWINLLDNAIKFSNPDGEIDIKIEQDQARTSVSIRNYGQPIGKQESQRIFQKFYQGDNSHAAEGTGIGLAIVKRIVDLHGGAVEVESDEAATTFRVNLPNERPER